MVDGLQHRWGQRSPVGLICPSDKMRLGFSVELGPMAEGEAVGKSSPLGPGGAIAPPSGLPPERLTEVTGMPGFKVAST
jgi:hypothetical protein